MLDFRPVENNLITPDETAAILDVSRSRIRQFVRDKDLATAGMFGPVTMFSRPIVEALRDKRAKNSSGAKRGPKTKRPAKKK